MPIDGVFLHHLVNELKETVNGSRINKIIMPNNNLIIFNIRKNKENHNLLLSSSLQSSRIHLTKNHYETKDTPLNFCILLRKYLDRGFIDEITQLENDRVVKMTIKALDELKDEKTYYLFLEIMGRNSNLILTNEDLYIIDAARHFVPSIENENSRIILPKAKYLLPLRLTDINPFTNNVSIDDINNLQGFSKVIKTECLLKNDVTSVINKSITPVIYKLGKSTLFYSCLLDSVDKEYTTFKTLSLLLDEVYIDTGIDALPQDELKKHVLKEINKLKQKLDNLNEDLENALSHKKDLELAQLIQTYLYKIKRGDTLLEVINPWTNEFVSIKLDPLLDPTKNMKKYFNSHKKSENAVIHINEWISKTKQEITYLEETIELLKFSDKFSLEQIKQELIDNHFLIKRTNLKNKFKIKKQSMNNIVSMNLGNAHIWIGKCSTQNNYLTNQLAKASDYWFHVKDAPGAHIILRCNELDERLIRICAHLASLNSSYKNSSSVPVDYTLVKYIKKIPRQMGFHVTYTNQSTIYIDPDQDTLDKLLSK